ncbi:MAG: tyrosine-type recombinase/integrase [Waterburya sp.]
MKIDRHGRAKIFTTEEIQLLFGEGFADNPFPERDRALFGICLYTACRINEACTIKTNDVYDRKGIVRDKLIIRKRYTKGKLATRTIPIIEDLRLLLVNYFPTPRTYNLFSGRGAKGHINPDYAAQILRKACHKLDLEGVSTHSFRRTALTQMSSAGIPLRVIQEISGHRTLDELQKYLEVSEEQVRGAVASLTMISHLGKPTYHEVTNISFDSFRAKKKEIT